MNPEYLENAQYITNLTGLIFKRGDDKRNVFECPDCGLLTHIPAHHSYRVQCICTYNNNRCKLLMKLKDKVYFEDDRVIDNLYSDVFTITYKDVEYKLHLEDCFNRRFDRDFKMSLVNVRKSRYLRIHHELKDDEVDNIYKIIMDWLDSRTNDNEHILVVNRYYQYYRHKYEFIEDAVTHIEIPE